VVTRRALVVGGAGYIGAHMVKHLLDGGWRVASFDNLSRGHRDAILGGRFIEGDLRDAHAIKAAVASDDFDVVFHFAALAYVGESVLQPANYYQNNLVGTLNLLEALREIKLATLVFSSSCAVYGDAVALPISEAHPQCPVNPYGNSKLACERAIADYAAAYGLRAACLRYFNAAGAAREKNLAERHEPETHLIPLVLAEARRVLRGGAREASALRVFGTDFDTPDGTCVRDYVHVEDLCDAHLRAAELLLDAAPGAHEAYNLGTGAGISVAQVISTARAITGVDFDYRRAPRRPGDPATLIASCERAKQALGWEPEASDLETILTSAWRTLR